MSGIRFVYRAIDIATLTCHGRVGFSLTLSKFTALHL
jgi:hypothetical protein